MKIHLKTGSLPDVVLRIVIVIGQVGLAVGLSTIALLRPQLPDALAGLQSLIGEAQTANAAYTPPALGASSAVLTVTKQVDGVQPTGQVYSLTLNGPSFTPPSATTILAGQSLTYAVAPGVYTVTEASPGAGWLITTTATSSGVITPVTSGNTAVVTLTNAITAALVTPAQITGTVYADLNENGNRNVGETGVPSVTVTAYDRNNTAVGSTTSNLSGTYALTPTAAGPWRFEFTNLPASYVPGRVFTGTQNGTSVQFVSSLPVTGGLFFGVGITNTFIEIGNRVWNDVNQNGVQDAGEPPISGAVVNLATFSGTITTTTNISGSYVFTREAATGLFTRTLRANTAYTVTINPAQAALSGLSLTSANVAAISGSSTSNDAISDTRDSDAVLVGITPTIFYTTGNAGQNNHGLDFGFAPTPTGTVLIVNTPPDGTATFGNFVWTENDGDGIAATGIITPVVGKIITATASDGTVYNQTTNASGYYTFVVPSGLTYTVSYGPAPAGTAPSATPNSGTASGGSPGTDQRSRPNNTDVFVAPDDVIPTIDFGFYLLPPNPVGSNVITVTKQVIGNGTGPFNIGLSGSNGYISNTTINNGGTISFSNLAPAIYTITEVSPGAGWLITSTTSGSAITTPVTSGNTAVVTLTGVITTPAFAATQVTGIVFNDYNSDGNRQTTGTVIDGGVSGVIVTAYDRNNAAVGSTTTAATGNYTFTPSAAGPWRLEFTNLPTGYEPGHFSTGTQNDTSVQFINTAAQASGADFGIVVPADYCQNNPMLCIPEMIAGDPQNATTGAVTVLQKWNYAAANGAPATVSLANSRLVGTVWGLAYARGTDELYSAAFLKRHTGLGPNGLGAIYVTSNPRSGVGVTTSLLLDVDTVAGVNVGTVSSNSARGLTTPSGTALDTSVYDQVGKVGLGDIEISDDESMLWTISLNDKKLIGIPLNNPVASATQVYTIPDPGCVVGSGDYRPFATKFYRGQLYVGVTCDASISRLQNDLSATVYRFNPANPGAGFASILNVPLNYVKGPANSACPSNPGARWFPWVNVPYPSGFNPACPTAGNKVLPQPLLSDLEFDVDGSLILGFIDRFAHQAASGLALPDGSNVGETMAGGDILRAWNNNGSFVLESNGTAGPVSGGVGNNDGPGGGEFYNGDFITTVPAVAETANGALAFLPGSDEVVTSIWDPFSADSTHGVAFLSNTDGAANRKHNLGANTRFAKGSGLGDLEILCNSAPIEIGNRVWRDNNGNGVQDAGELGIGGVAVRLLDPTTGAVLQTVTTTITGTYVFTREAATGAFTNTLQPKTAYSISVATGQGVLSGLLLTIKDVAAISGSAQSNNSILDVRDSDATLLGSNAQIYYTTGNAGQNNHGLDFGFAPSTATGTVAITNTAPVLYDLGNHVWFDTNNDGTLNGGEQPIGSVTMQLRNITNTVIATTTTNASGYYSFTNLAAGTYSLTVAASNFAAGGALAGYWSSTGVSANITTTGNNLDHGIDPATLAAYVANGVSSGAVTVGPVPTGEDATAPTTPNGDGFNNLTLDFGFYRQQVGNTIWIDTNNDGLFNNGEVPYAASTLTVTLLDNAGTLISSTTTTNGIYTFTNVAGGTYVVSVTLPAGYVASTPVTNTAGLDNNNNGTQSGQFVVSAPFTATPGTTIGSIVANDLNGTTYNPSIDFGILGVATFGNFVWIESDTDGIAASGTITPVVGKVITATDSAGVVYTQTTDVAGFYTSTVPSGVYTVTYGTAPSGTVPSATPNSNTASAGSLGTDQQSRPANTVVTLAPGDVITTIDFGFNAPNVSLAQFGDRVWIESDTDGLASTGTITPVAGMVITASDGTNVYTTTTNAQGYYSFTVNAGTYTVTYGAAPSWYGLVVASATPGSNTASGNAGSYQQAGNPDQSRPQNSTITLALGEANWTMDYAFNVLTATFGNFVWIESDNDGIATNGIITPVVGKIITATSSAGRVFTQTTNAQGYYTFTVPVDTYTVSYGPAPIGTVPSTTPNPGTASTGSQGTDQNSRPNGTVVTLAANAVIPTIDFGFYVLPPNPAGSNIITVTKQVIGGGSGPFNIGLSGSNGYISNTTINNGETVTFSNLAPAVYTITEVSPGAGWLITSTASSNAITTPVIGGNTAVVTLTAVMTTPTFAATQITGQVFNDFNDDGNITANGTVTDTGVPSVTVTAYDVNNNAVGSTTTTVSGTYALTPSAAGPWRLEFTNLPSGYNPSRVITGIQNGSSVQFVNSAPAGNVNFGIHLPADYCQNNPNLCTSMFINGGINITAPVQAMVRLFPSTAQDILADKSEIGSTWGIAYGRQTGTLYAAAFLKRHVGMGPNGPGAIYAIPNANTTALTPTLLVDLAAQGIDVGQASILSNDTRGLGAPSDLSQDATTYDQVGKLGLGDLDISEDDSTLWVINLNSRTLVKIPIATPTGANIVSYAVPDPGCTGGTYRPFGIKVHQGDVYVGVICDAQSSQNKADLRASVYKFTAGAFVAVPVLQFALNYPKGWPTGSDAGCTPFNGWFPWVQANVLPPACYGSNITVYPQPILSDIEFDNDGSMILGFMDRLGHQLGFQTPSPFDVNDFRQAFIGGDLLRASTNGISFTLESNGSVGGRTGGIGNGQGPNGGEFYLDSADPTSIHQEAGNGGLALLPGSDLLMMTALQGGNTGGVNWYNNLNGQFVRLARLYSTGIGSGTFAKANGLGDLELMCDSAPIEIGNRVWRDTNGNGVQDAGELGLSGVQVQLLNPISGAVLQTVTTDLNGRYVFTREAATGAFSTTLRTNTAYSISVVTGQTALSGLSLTAKDAQAINGSAQSNDAILDVRDSDATLFGSSADIYYTTGNAGQSNHGLDFGFVPVQTGQVDLVNTAPTQGLYDLGNRVWFDTNDDGILNAGEQPITNVTMQLRNITGTVIATTTTNASGYYAFTNLAAGTYSVTVAASNFVAGGRLFDYRNSDPTTASSNVAGDNNRDHGVNPFTDAEYLTDGISSDAITLGAGLPTGEDGSAPTTPNGDSNNNLTIDFGFYSQQIGNTIWVDTNDDGLLNNGEVPFAGPTLTVTLYSDTTGDEIAITTTTGIYTFTNVPSGTYLVWVNLPPNYRSSRPLTQTAGLDNNNTGATYGGSTAYTSDYFTATPGTSIGSILANNVNGTTTNPGIDFGIVGLGQFGDRVWFESDTDGIASTGLIEPVVGMVITATNGAFVYTTTTNAQGYYSFTIAVGTYTVTYGAVPTTYGVATPSATPLGNTASGNAGSYQQVGNPDQSRPQASTVTVAPGEANWTMDFGFHALLTRFGDRLWIESDTDGLASTGVITPLPYIVITATNGPLVYTTTTDTQGYYSFTVPAGTYTVTYGALPTVYGLLTPSATPGGNTVSGNAGSYQQAGNPDQNHANNTTVTLTSGQTNWTVDFGFNVPFAQFGNFVWIENDNDGIASTGTITPVVGKVITATASSGAMYVQTTNASGYYTFVVPAGLTYTVSYGPAPAGTIPSATPNSGTASGGSPGTDQRSRPNNTIVVLVNNDVIPTIDFGFYLLLPNPLGVNVITVTKQVIGASGAGPFNLSLNGSNGYISNTTINDGGTVVFDNLGPAIYTVTEVSPGAGWLITSTASSSGITTPVTSGNSAIITLSSVINVPPVAPGAITGRVYNDYNSDGNITTSGVVETGVQSVTVTAYDRDGTAVGSTTTDATGNYTFTPSAAGPWRLEFTGLPSGYNPSRVSTGIQNGTTTQFVDSAPASNVNLGIVRTLDYIGGTPKLATVAMSNGDPLLAGTAASMNSVFWLDAGASGFANNPNVLATAAQVGSTYGVAWQPDSQRLFVSAVVRRHAGLGVGGLGGIYVIANPQTAPAVSLFVDLESAPFNINLGNLGDNASRGLPASKSSPSLDRTAFGAVGKQGLGDIDVTEDQQWLFAVDLNNRALIRMNVAGGSIPTSATSYALSSMPGAPSCTLGVLRPWGLKFYNGNGYVGAVCTGENGTTNTNLNAYVLRFDPNNPTSLTTILSVPLNYTKGYATGNNAQTHSKNWNYWTEAMTDADWPLYAENGPSLPSAGSQQVNVSRPMAMLSDIEFDASGNMVLGLRDRGGDMFGSDNYWPNSTTFFIDYRAGGDVLKACADGVGSWTLESNGICGGVNGRGVGSGQGPGGGEFYNDDYPNYPAGTHQEISVGGLAARRDVPEIALTVYDAVNIFDNGIRWLNNANGSVQRNYSFIQPASSNSGYFGKANSMGDLELMYAPAPIEIGNRVWNDVNGNGVQDPGEPAISGVEVQLIDPTTGVVLQTVTTDVNGTYYFNREANSGPYATTLRPNTAYSISIATDQGLLSGYQLTVKDAQAISGSTQSNDAILDVRDSDATLFGSGAGSVAQIFYTTGNVGQSNHGLDFGFVPVQTGQVDLVNTAPPLYDLGNRVWFDTNNDGVMNIGEQPTSNVTMQLRNITGTVIATTTTNASGYYAFTNLVAGTYSVTVAASNFVAGGTLQGYWNSSPTMAASNLAGDNGNDHGVNPLTYAVYLANGVSSGPITLGAGLPTSEDATAPTTPNGDSNNNLTIDFGFYTQQVGNTIWVDANDDGLLNNGELPYTASSITVTLVDDSSGAMVSTTTTTTGLYTFTGVPSGTFVVSITVPAGFSSSTPTTNTAGLDNNDNGAPSGAFIVSAPFTATPGTNLGSISSNPATGTTVNPSIDFGLYAPATFGNFVWIESDTNGIAAGGTITPVVGKVITATSSTGVVYTETTDAQGYYTFTVPSGVYTVTYGAAPNGTVPSATPNSNTASAGNPGTDQQSRTDNTVVTLVPGDVIPTIDFGFNVPMAQFGDRVWIESDTDGLASTGTITPVAGMVISATDGTNVYTTTTNAAGYYSFTVDAGTYTVTHGAVPVVYGTVTPSATPGGNNESGNAGAYQQAGNPDQSHANNTTVTLAAGQANWTVDFGFNVPPVQFGDRVFLESDTDGIATTGAITPITGMVITATNGTSIYTTTTNAAGYYSFTVPADTYTVTYGAVPVVYGVVTPSATPLGSTASGNAGSYQQAGNPDQSRPQDSTVTLTPGQANWTLDYAFNVPLAQFGDRLWIENDTDGDASTGVIIPVVGKLITATNGTSVYTTTTNAQGYYSFTVPGGTYTVTYGTAPSGTVPSATPGGNSESGNAGTYQQAGNPDQSHANNTTVTVSAGQANWTVDFGFNVPPAQFGDRVFVESDTDGLASTGVITPVVGKLITATNGTTTYTTTTNAQGYYSFTVPAGTYTVTYGVAPVGTVPSATPGGNTESGNAGTYQQAGSPDQSHANNTTVTLTAGEANWTVDFGFNTPPTLLSIGNRVWFDTNNDGVVTTGEQNVAGVAMELYQDTDGSGLFNAGDTLISSTVTNAAGYYTFTNLPPSVSNATQYLVVITNTNFMGGPLTGYRNSAGSVGNTLAADNDKDHGSQLGTPSNFVVASNSISLTLGTQPVGEANEGNDPIQTADDADSNQTIDFGFYKLEIGNRVWFDANSNGLDDGELGAANVPVTLTDGLGNVLSTTTTNGQGYYTFTGVASGTFMVKIQGPANYQSTTPDDTTGNTDLNDNGQGTGGGVISSQVFTMTPGTTSGAIVATNADGTTRNPSIDFGLESVTAGLGDFVWEDYNHNGVQDAGEPGISGVTVTLRTPTTTLTTQTDASGFYSFTNLLPGVPYTVSFTAPGGYTFTLQTATLVTATDSNPNPVTGVAPSVTLGNNEFNNTIDAGLWRPMSLGNRVWFDTNNDGVRSVGEQGVGGVTVTLQTPTTTLLTQTDTDGYYTFTNLISGTYVVVLPSGNFTGAGALVNYRSSDVTELNPNADVDNTDNGIVSGTLGSDGFVASGAIVLRPGTEPVNESDPNDTDSNTNWTIDFGFYTQQIGNTIWVDANDDGLLNNGELPYTASTITVTLVDDGTGAVISTTTTTNGLYNFTGVPSGTYVVSITVPAGFSSSTPTTNTAGLDNNDNGAPSAGAPSGAFIVSAPFTATPGTNLGSITSDDADGSTVNPSIDFGLYVPVQFGDRVWIESDTDGDAGTGMLTPIAGMVMTATNGTNVYTTTTNAQGYYSFTVPADTYTVTHGAVPVVYGAVVPSATPLGNTASGNAGSYQQGGNPDQSRPQASTVTLTPGQANWTLDFAFNAPLVQFGDRVFVESDNDGLASTGVITPVAGIVITATDGTATYTTTTNVAGFYSFTVNAGTYTVTYGAVPAVYGTVTPSATPGGNTESGNAGSYQQAGNPDQSHVNGTTVTLSAGEANWTVDFGFNVPLAQFGNFVWIESDTDGIAATGLITPVVGKVITATDANGTVYTQTTNAAGYYTFTLPAGVYTVTYGVAPAGTTPSATPNPGTASAGSPGADQQSRPDNTVVTLAPGDVITTIDFGFNTPLYDLGNRVWFDTDNDGINGAGEQPISNVTMLLRDISGAVVATTTTNASGYYVFANLPAGTYTAVVAAENFALGETLAGYWNSSPTTASSINAGDNDLDHGVNPATYAGYLASGVSSGPVVLGPGLPTGEDGSAPVTPNGDVNNNLTIDFGFYQLQVGNLVWEDLDNDGVRDAGEPGLSGVGVTLYASNGTTVISTTTTDASGLYTFTGVPSGTYVMAIQPTGLYTSSLGTGGESDPNSNIDHADAAISDNGVILAGGQVRSNLFNLTPGDAGALNNTSVNTATGTTTNPTLDFGLWQPAALGDYVWSDLDADGQQDAGEPGVNGVVVTLYRNGSVISTTTTANVLGTDGYYTFTNLISGTYSVTFGLPAGFIGFTAPNASIDAADSDAVPVNATLAATGNYVLLAGEQNPTVDAGLIRPASLGDRVWEDWDHDGVQDVGEPGVSAVTVTLRTPTTTLTTQTNPSGLYSFTNLLPGVPYTVSFTAPTGYTFTVPNATTTTLDSNVTTPQGDTPPVTLVAGENNLTIDAGLWRPMSLGNRVWEDLDNDGVRDAGEPGIAGVVVTLQTPTTTLTTQTDSTGRYTFTNLISGTYGVSIAAPSGYRSSTPDGGDPDNNVDDDDNGIGSGFGQISSQPITLVANSEPTADDVSEGLAGNTNSNWTVDFGLWRPASLGNYAWEDTNKDGVQNEPAGNGLNGVTVQLLDAAGKLISQTVTANDPNGQPGYYTFTNLISQMYRLRFDLSDLPGYQVTTRGPVGVKDASDSDADAAGQTELIALNAGEVDPTWDLGVWRPSGLGDRVWEDLNHDGVQSAGEPGIGGVTVTLQTPTTTLTTQTNASGLYSFTNLLPNTPYTVSFAPPAGYTFTVQTATVVTATDSNPNPVTGVSAPVTLLPDEFNPTIDAGLWRPAALGNYVWSDVNRDGVQNEPVSNGINGVTVNLLNASGAVIATQLTHNDPNGQPGYYTFTNLLPGDYAVQVVLPAGYVFTTQDQGGAGADAQDSDVNPATGRTMTTTLVAGEQDPTWDAGLVLLASLGNYVWSDLNQNGVQDAGEPAVPGVTVTLYDAAGAPVSSTVTAANGSYAFVNLIPGSYSVGFTVPNGYTFTAQQTGGNPASDVDSNPNPTTGRTPSVTLQPGENNPTIDAGLVPLAGLGNVVWSDLNQNSVQDAGEPGVPGVIVTLQTPGGISTTVTNASGFYSFTNLMPGVPNTVTFTLPPGYRFTVPGTNPGSDVDSNANPDTGVAAPVVLTPGEFNPTIDAGLVQPVGLGDRVWFDTNHDGVQDSGEPGVPGMTVTLQTPTTTLTTLTDASGFYSFTNLVPNVPYTASFTAPDGYTFTVPGTTTTTLDSNVTTPSGGTPPVVLGSGEYNPTIDAGLWQLPPTLVLTKTAQMMRNVIRSGELVTYTLVARNDGPGIAYNVVISDPLPGGLEYIPGSAVPMAQVNGQTLVWTRPTLGVGENFTLTLVARVQPSAQVTGARIVNVGYALAYAPDNTLVDVPATPLVDDAQAGIIFEPTAVVLTVLRSTWLSDGAGVHVEWQTGSEINTLGFGLYRSTDGTRASAVLVTPELIRSGSVNNGGASYSFDDLTATPGQTYTYWLQEIETSGAVYEYGPVDTDGKEIFRPRELRLFLPTLMR